MTKSDLIDYLKEFTTEERLQRMQQILEQRTKHITVVLEDIYQPHNASAVLRSCDGFGIQDVHVIENLNEFDASSQVTIGADQWLNIHRYNQNNDTNIDACFSKLRNDGYSIIATTPHEQDSNINDINIDKPLALVFGTELDGVTDEIKEKADGFVKIPMYGFSESFNISVSAAICLYDLSTRLRNNTQIDWKLSNSEKQDLLINWLVKSIKAGDNLLNKWLKDHSFKDLNF